MDDSEFNFGNITDPSNDVLVRRAAVTTEISRLGQLMHRGEESEEEFRRLIKLLQQVIQTNNSKYRLIRSDSEPSYSSGAVAGIMQNSSRER